MKNNRHNRQRNLESAAMRLAQAQRIVQDMMDSLTNGQDMFEVNDVPAQGLTVLEKLGVIEVFDHDTKTAMDSAGDQRPLIMAVAKS